MVLSRWKCVAALAVASCLLQGPAAVFAEDVDTTAATASCSLVVAAEDAARGLDVVTDATCANGGVDGCIDAICRHCRITQDTTDEEIAKFPSCLDYVNADSDLSGSGDDADGDDGSEGSGDSDDGGSGVMGDVPAHLTADATVSGSSYGCPFPTSGSDFAAGIQLVGDTSCARGGLGCFASVCRFCKFQESPKSAHLLTCESLGYKVRKPLVVPVLPPVNPATGCPYNISSGDFAVGVQLVGDPSCGGGGLGCFKEVCRFCKFSETPQSSHWRSCADFGYPRTPAPPAFATVSLEGDDGEWTGETACAYAVSKGDFAVGIQLVGDASCANGGLGCFGNTCRYCQFRETIQSKHMLTCKQLGFPRPPTQPIGTPQDIGISDAVTGCPFPISAGDFAAGVQLVGDTTCAKGGLGCFKDVCRFCKFKETPQSTHWVPCSDYNYPPVAPPIVQPADINEPAVDYATGCPFPVSSGDYAAGIQLVGDATCVKGGNGCFKDVCRFCKFQETPQSKNWVTCDSLGWPRTVAPIARPVDITEDPATECPYPVSKGDFAAGVQLVGDASCVKGGLGCYKNVCRFCKFQESPQSKHWVPCSDLGYPRNGATFTPVSIDANDETGCPYPVSSGDYDAGVQLVGDSSCTKGGVGCFKDTCRFCKFRMTPQSSAYLNCEDLGYFFGSDSTALVPAPPCAGPSTKCPFTASPSEQAAGVLLVGDATCDEGGVGCYQNVCRYCQLVPTEKSNEFATCASLGYDYALPPMPTQPAPTTAPPPLPTTTAPPPPPPTTPPAPTAAPTLPPCAFAVSPGDFAVGINLVGDPSCAAGGVGCFQNVCRYCKFKDTPQAANWVACSNYLPQPIAAPVDIVETAPPTTLPPPPTPPPVTPPPVVAKVCDSPVSQGDKDVGVGLATDYSCLIRGLGCVQGTVCRFCRVFQSEKSNHLESCATYGGAVGTAPIEAPPPAAVDPTACVARLAIGETQGGVGAFYDASCSPSGGVGCFGGVCRYCQVFASDKSKDFVPCPLPAPAAVAAAATTAPPTAPSVVATAPNVGPAMAPLAPAAPAAAPAAPAVPPTDPAAAPAAPAVAPANPAAAPAAPAVAPPDPNAAAPAAPAVATPTDPNAAPVAGPVAAPAPAPAPPVAPLRAAAKEFSTGFAATEKRLDELLQDKTFRWSMLGAACVGIVAVVALVALGAKRVVTRRKQACSTDKDAETSESEAEEARAPTPKRAPPTPMGVQEDEV